MLKWNKLKTILALANFKFFIVIFHFDFSILNFL
jgi:hypothetical protein